MATKKVIEQLVTELTADGAKMKKELDKSFKDAKTWGDKVTSVATKVSLGLAAGAGTVALGMAAAVKQTIDAGREIRNLSAIANENAQEFQRIAFATKGYGVEQDKLADILKDTSDKVGDFLQNGAGPLQDFFDNIAPLVGVTADQFRDLSGREALQLYVSSLEKANLSQSEMTFYMEAIASDATLLLPLLRNNGSELERLAARADKVGKVLSDVELDQLKQVDDALLTFGQTVDGVMKEIGVALLPQIIEFTELLNDPKVVDGLKSISTGLIDGAKAAIEFSSELGDLYRLVSGFDTDNLEQVEKQIELVKQAIESPSQRLRFFGKDGWVTWYSESELQTEMAKLVAQRDKILEASPPPAVVDSSAWNEEAFLADVATAAYNKNIAAKKAKLAADRENKKVIEDAAKAQQKLNDLYLSEMDALHRQVALKTDATEVDRLRYEFEYGKLQDINAERKKQLESMAAEIDLQQQIAVAVAEKAARNASLKEVEDLLKTEVERTNAAWDARVKIIENAGLSAERQAELVTQAEAKRAEELKAIHDQEMAELIARRQAQLAGAASLFGSLADLTEKFAGENSRIYKAMFIAEKSANIARAGVAIKTGIAEASSQPFPTNLAAMISVAAATSGLLSDIESINIAHGGLENVPKESTYLLDKGERVLSPKQNTDLTQFLDESRSGHGGMKVEIINNTGSGAFNASASMLNDQTLQIILTAVDTKLRQDLSAGRGVWRDGQHRYGWPTKGSI